MNRPHLTSVLSSISLYIYIAVSAASRLAALLLGHKCPICFLVAPGQPGASPPADVQVCHTQDTRIRRASLGARRMTTLLLATSAARGERAPVNEAVLRLAERVEQGDLVPSPENAPHLIAALYA